MKTLISNGNVKLKENQGLYFVLVNGLNTYETASLTDAVLRFDFHSEHKRYTAVHIDTIKAGDTIQHDGHERTVCSKDIKHDAFNGTTIFGYSYMLGYLPVIKIEFI